MQKTNSERRNSQFNNNSRRLQSLTVKNRYNIGQKIKKNIEDLEIINQLDLTSNSRIHILLKCT